MSNGQQPTGHLRWQQRTVHTEADNYQGRVVPILQQQFGVLNGWAWSGLEWRDVPTVDEDGNDVEPY